MKTFKQINFRDINIPNVLVMAKDGDEWFWLQNFLDEHLDGAFILEEKEEDVQADDDKPQKDERWIPTEEYCWRVGDEVEDIDRSTTFVISAIDEDGDIRILKKSGNYGYISKCSKSYYRKTGRHFPQIKEVLDLLKEGGEK